MKYAQWIDLHAMEAFRKGIYISLRGQGRLHGGCGTLDEFTWMIGV